MAISPEFRDFILEQLEPLGPVSARAMFGGAGLYLDGILFALIARDVLYLRTDEVNRGDFERVGSGPFTPSAAKPYTLPYHEAPAEALDDADDLCRWARGAWEAAKRARTKAERNKARNKAT